MQQRYRLKSCTKCKGDLSLDSHQEWVCIQCGHTYSDYVPYVPKLKKLGRTR